VIVVDIGGDGSPAYGAQPTQRLEEQVRFFGSDAVPLAQVVGP
jgi:hypothetical protein